MFRFRNQDHYEPAIDEGDDRDLIALMNEARDPGELAQLADLGRQRVRARTRRSAARRTRGASARDTRHSLGRVLSFRS